MKRILIAAISTAALTGMSLAADLPNKKGPIAPAPAASADGFDFAFGAKFMSDYISRGITQSNHLPSATAYLEGRYNLGDTQFYAAVQPWTVHLPTKTSAEVDLSLGVRQTIGKFSVDIGGVYYLYPNNKNQYFTDGVSTRLNPIGATPATCAGIGGGGAPALPPGLGGGIAGLCATTARNPSFLELYIKPSYNITDAFNVGANLYFAPNWNNYKFTATYISGTAKYTFGETGISVSGEFGRQFLGSLKPGTIFNAGPASFKYPSFNAYNLGVSYAYKNLTADIRYYGSSLNKASCYVATSDPAGNLVGGIATGRSNWCGQRVMASISVDFLYSKDFRK